MMKNKSQNLFFFLSLLIFIFTLIISPDTLAQKKQAKEIHVFTWANYISQSTTDGFNKEFGVKVIVDTYASNEDLLAKLQSGATGYDLIFPSDYMVAIMIKENLLSPIDISNVPNFKNISGRFKGLYYDPGNKYSIPYVWGTAGIAYDSKKVSPSPDSWAALWNAKYKGQISMLNDMRETLGASLKLLGYSLNSTDAQQLTKARNKLIEQRSLVKKYESETTDLLVAGEVALAHAWSGDAIRAAKEKPSIKFVVPKEGATIFADNICIPKLSKEKHTAEIFINYILRPEISATVTDFTQYASCNEASKKFVKKEILSNPGVFPPEAALNKLEWIKDVGAAIKLYDRAWTEVKSSR
jgi:spermidine/putrescine-binding protein